VEIYLYSLKYSAEQQQLSIAAGFFDISIRLVGIEKNGVIRWGSYNEI
jgi:hypothetical protein